MLLCTAVLTALCVEAGESELNAMLSKIEDDVLEFATEMEALYNERCSVKTRDECAKSNYEECSTLFPDQTCISGSILERPECIVRGQSCSALADFTVSNVRLSENVVKDADGNPVAAEVRANIVSLDNQVMVTFHVNLRFVILCLLFLLRPHIADERGYVLLQAR